VSWGLPAAFLLFIPLIAWAILKGLARGREALPFSTLKSVFDTERSWRQRLLWLPAFLQLAAAAALILALARPQTEEINTREQEEGIAIEILVDVSSSMDMEMNMGKKRETRLNVARDVVQQFVLGNGDSLKGRPNDLIGIITFARYADTICPLTLGHEAVAYLADQIKIHNRPNEDGTAFGDAAALAVARLSKLEEIERADLGEDNPDFEVKSKIIVLLTDGENNCGMLQPDQAASLAKEYDIRIYTISIGDPPKMRTLTTDQGNITIRSGITATEQILSDMAEQTGGIFRTAHDYDSLQAVYSEIDKLERSRLRPVKYSDTREWFLPFALAALGMMLTESTLRSTLLRKVP
jgi:Ca-activated chloride channel family protein